jgi:excisionase family DNA binding protein
MRTRLHKHREQSDLPKKLLRVEEAVIVLSLSRTVIYEEMRAGRLCFVVRGNSRRIPVEAIDEYVRLLKEETQGGQGK